MTNIIISGLPPQADELELVKLIVPFARVNTVHIAFDKRTGKPSGIAFIELHDYQEALEAVAGLHGAFMGKARLSAKLAEDKPKKERPAPKAPATFKKQFQAAGTNAPEKKKRPRIQR